MKKLFIHHPLFRLLSPLFSGALVYLLILLINNNIAQIRESFLGQELYICIALAYIIQEYARFSLLLFEKIKGTEKLFWKLIIQVLSSVAVCIVLVSGVMYIYFSTILKYSPNSTELLIFNSIFAVITIIYLALYLSHQFLYKINTNRIEEEVIAKRDVEEDFVAFKKGINPELLFESLEALIVLMKQHPEAAEAMIDNFSSVYRYILSRKKRELISLEEELNALQELLQLYNHLPYRKTRLARVNTEESYVVPGCLLLTVERIIKSTILSKDQDLLLDITTEGDFILVCYSPQEKLRTSFTDEAVADIAYSYQFYTSKTLSVIEEALKKTIQIPKLTLNESSDH